jgi:hypothetical protein
VEPSDALAFLGIAASWAVVTMSSSGIVVIMVMALAGVAVSLWVASCASLA